MGFGDFMSGMQGGMQAMDEFKNSRQRRKLYDRAMTESDMEFDAKDFDRAKQGYSPDRVDALVWGFTELFPSLVLRPEPDEDDFEFADAHGRSGTTGY